VLFDVDKFNIKPEYRQHLQDAADFMKKHPDAVMDLAGHTDSDASNEYNVKLAKNRVEAIRRYLIKFGVDPRRLSPTSHSEDRPAKPNDSKANKAENRRVIGRAKAEQVGVEPALQGYLGSIQ